MSVFGTCRTCRFWNDEGDNLGTCHRYAPRPRLQLHPTGDDSIFEEIVWWPPTTAIDSCGEHLARSS